MPLVWSARVGGHRRKYPTSDRKGAPVRRAGIMGLTAVLLVVTGCGGASSPTATSTVAPTATVTPKLTPTTTTIPPSPTPTPCFGAYEQWYINALLVPFGALRVSLADIQGEWRLAAADETLLFDQEWRALILAHAESMRASATEMSQLAYPPPLRYLGVAAVDFAQSVVGLADAIIHVHSRQDFGPPLLTAAFEAAHTSADDFNAAMQRALDRAEFCAIQTGR